MSFTAEVRCVFCERVIGAMSAPDSIALRSALKGTPYAGLASLLPANIVDVVAPLLLFGCRECLTARGMYG